MALLTPSCLPAILIAEMADDAPIVVYGTPNGTTTVQVSSTAEAGLIATGNVLEAAASEAGFLRALYNEGAAHIAEVRTALMEEVTRGTKTEEQVARQLARMRTEHAMMVRRAGSALMRRAAELFDSARGNLGRPTYESLREAGKTDAQIIASAAKTNRFINALPKKLRWTGRGFWLISVGISVVVVINAEPGERDRVARDEVNSLLGGMAGGALVTAGFIAFGAATAGAGYLILVFVGSAAGAWAGREVNLLSVLDIAPHENPAQAGRMYYVEGDWSEIDLLVVSYVKKRVRRKDGILVIATGMESGEMIGGRGHYRKLEVVPATQPAMTLFAEEGGNRDVRWVPEYLLHPVEPKDLFEAGEN